jgi:TolA-binding protein
MKRGLSVILIMVLVISMAANFFSFNKLTSAEEETNQKAKLLLEEKEQEIGKLNDEISSLNKERQGAAGNENPEKVEKEVKRTTTENEAEKSGGQKGLVNSAERFIDYIYNVTPDNFAMVKQNADHYMTDEMIKTLFPSDGIDEKESDLKTSATDIKVFMEGEGNKQAVVSYNFELEFISSGYKEQDSSYVLLDFEQEGGTYKVSKLTPINSMKGEISSIDAIGYLKGGGMLP